MEKIRVIKKNGTNQVVGDRLLTLDGIKLNPIDKPVFVELRESNPQKMVFSYPRSAEKVGSVTSANGHFTVEYGTISGRIKVVIPQRVNMSETDRYELIRAITALGTGVRFKENVCSQLKMVGKLLPELSL